MRTVLDLAEADLGQTALDEVVGDPVPIQPRPVLSPHGVGPITSMQERRR